PPLHGGDGRGRSGATPPQDRRGVDRTLDRRGWHGPGPALAAGQGDRRAPRGGGEIRGAPHPHRNGKRRRSRSDPDPGRGRGGGYGGRAGYVRGGHPYAPRGRAGGSSIGGGGVRRGGGTARRSRRRRASGPSSD